MKYLVKVEYHRTYFQNIEIEAEDVEQACENAIEQADDWGAWTSYDEMGPSYVAWVESHDDPGRAADNCVDVPVKFAEGVMLVELRFVEPE